MTKGKWRLEEAFVTKQQITLIILIVECLLVSVIKRKGRRKKGQCDLLKRHSTTQFSLYLFN